MSKPDWKGAPTDAEYARHWMGKMHWFKRHPTDWRWYHWDGEQWGPSSMCNAVFHSLERRP